LEQPATANANHPRTNDQKISSCLRVPLRDKGIFVSEWLADLFKINERQLGESEICEGSGKKRLDTFRTIFVLNCCANRFAFAPCPVTSARFREGSLQIAASVQLEHSFPVHAVCAGRLLGQGNQFSAIRRREQPIICLQISANFAKRHE